MRHVVTAMVFGLTGFPGTLKAATEYELKAVYLLNFAKTVELTATGGNGAGAPLVIGVLGSDPFGSTLTRVCRGETAGGRPMTVRRSTNASSLGDCHIVFVGKSEASRASSVVSRLSRNPILLIGDFSPFAAKGGHLNFVMKSGSVRFEFNAQAAKRSGLRIPSRIQRSGIPVSAR